MATRVKEDAGPKEKPPVWQPGGNSPELMRAVIKAFEGQTVHRPPTWKYRLALMFAAVGLALLIVAYFACIAGIGFGLFLFVFHVIPATLHVRGRGVIAAALMDAGVVIAGLALLYSLIAALFRRHGDESESRLLSPGACPVLYCFVKALCTLIRAPVPDEIRMSQVPNASAGRRGGFLGVVGGRLVLEIGAPLLCGLELKALAGVVAHELGHFSQATSGLLFRFVATVANWFAEATERTEGVQAAIRDKGEDFEGWGQALFVAAALVAWLGRLILIAFALLSRVVTFSLMRQMEYDADRYEAQVAGSAQFARTFERVCELNMGLEKTIKAVMHNSEHIEPGGSLTSYILAEADALSERDRQRVIRRMGQPARWFDTHPSPQQRIAAVNAHPHPGIFHLEGPASCLMTAPVVGGTPELSMSGS